MLGKVQNQETCMWYRMLLCMQYSEPGRRPWVGFCANEEGVRRGKNEVLLYRQGLKLSGREQAGRVESRLSSIMINTNMSAVMRVTGMRRVCAVVDAVVKKPCKLVEDG